MGDRYPSNKVAACAFCDERTMEKSSLGVGTATTGHENPEPAGSCERKPDAG